MAILSIQSQLAAGYVGNSAAVFALQRRGREVWPLPTVLLSHHPAHGGSQGGPVPAGLHAGILDGLTARNCFSHCEAVLSGYLGQAASADTVRAAVSRARAGTPGAVYFCDPVLGDDGRLYVDPAIIAEMHALAAIADIISPNAFELGVLAGTPIRTRKAALQAMRDLQTIGPGIVLLTSFAGADTPAGTLDLMAIDGARAWRLNIPAFAKKFNGAGDLFAAIFLDIWLTRRDTAAALGETCTLVYGVLAETTARQADELSLLETQPLPAPPDPAAAPPIFTPERLD